MQHIGLNNTNLTYRMKLDFDRSLSSSSWSPFILVWKRNCVEKGYYEDNFIKHFAIKTYMEPLGNLYMYLRVVGIRKVISSFFDCFKGQNVQFVNLGSGLDPLSLWVLENYDNATCFDVDLEYQIKLKVDVITKTQELLSLFPDYQATECTFNSSRYKILPCDLRHVNELDKLKDYGFSNELPTIYLSEFALTYIENHLSNKVISKLYYMTTSPSIFLFFEFTNPSGFFAKWYLPVVQQHNVTMYSFYEYPTFESQFVRLTSLGWDDAFFKPVTFVYNYMIDKDERKRLRNLENFNDMPNLSLYCNFFVIGVGCKKPAEYKRFFEKFREYELKIDLDDELMGQFDPKDLEREYDISSLQEFVKNCLDRHSPGTEEQNTFFKKFN